MNEIMKPYVRGKNIYFREICVDDADFVLSLRKNPEKNKYLSVTDADLQQQQEYIKRYQGSTTDFYFVIMDWSHRPLGTVRIYDIRDISFCWGSWILSDLAPMKTALESALLIYDFAFFSLHYQKSHFDVRKENYAVVSFHQKFGAKIVSEDELNYYFIYDLESYLIIRNKYKAFLT